MIILWAKLRVLSEHNQLVTKKNKIICGKFNCLFYMHIPSI